jgi:hypothetical protein
MSRSSSYFLLTGAATAVIALVCSSCLLGAEPAPGYPGYHLRTFDCSGYGEPAACCFSSNGLLAVASAGKDLLFFELRHGNLLGSITLDSDVIAVVNVPDGDQLLVLSEQKLFVVSPAGFTVTGEVELAGAAAWLSISHDGSSAWVLHTDGFITRLAPSDWGVLSYDSIGIGEPSGLAASGDGASLFVGSNGDSTICRLAVPGLEPTGECEVYNTVISLFKGPDGMLCALVDGSNEIWFIDEGSFFIDYMMTVPDVPICGASMPDGSFAYAGVPGTGLVVCSSSGEHVLTTAVYGLPSSVALESEGWNAVICSTEQMSISILEK